MCNVKARIRQKFKNLIDEYKEIIESSPRTERAVVLSMVIEDIKDIVWDK